MVANCIRASSLHHQVPITWMQHWRTYVSHDAKGLISRPDVCDPSAYVCEHGRLQLSGSVESFLKNQAGHIPKNDDHFEFLTQGMF